MLNSLVTNQELAALWNLFESLQSRSTDKYGLDQDIFYRYVSLCVSQNKNTDSYIRDYGQSDFSDFFQAQNLIQNNQMINL